VSVVKVYSTTGLCNVLDSSLGLWQSVESEIGFNWAHRTSVQADAVVLVAAACDAVCHKIWIVSRFGLLGMYG
jgi:hypothetical protein